MTRPRIVVCGGGLAGIAAAVEAAGLGAEVTLVERRPFLGGKAFSFTDRESGREVDNGQHVFLGCCPAYMRLLRLLGTLGDTSLQRRLDAPVRDRAGRVGALRAGPLPAPLHLAGSFATYPHLSPREKAGALRGLAALAAMSERARADLDGVTFADWLAARGQPPGAVRRFWDLIVLPTCNDRSDRVSAALAAFVFRRGFLQSAHGSAIGWSRVGLTRLVDPAARRFLAARGGRVVAGEAVAEAGPEGVTLADGTALPADGVVLALPPQRVAAACPAALPRRPRPRRLADRERARLVRPAGDGRALHGGGRQPGPVDLQPHGDGRRRRRLPPPGDLDLGRARRGRRAARRAGRGHVGRAGRAAAARPGGADPGHRRREGAPGDLRPGPRSGRAPARARRRRCPGVALAGAWTATGWPATMEGAVRSGIAAARHVMAPPGPG